MKRYLSIDIGGSYIKFGLLSECGNFIEKWKIVTPSSLHEFKEKIKGQILEKQNEVIGVAMSCPGKIDSSRGFVYTCGCIKYLYDFHMYEWISSFTNLQFSILNDGKAAVLAEKWMGNLKGIKNGAAIVLGSAVGGGLIINNQLYHGATFQAGELSFMLQYPKSQNKLDIFGNQGSAVNFMCSAAKILGVDKSDYCSIFKNLESKSDERLQNMFKSYCEDIAIQLINIQVLLNLEKIVIGGGISEQELVINGIKSEYYRIFKEIEILERTIDIAEIDVCAFRNASNLLGALYYLIEQDV